MLDWFFVLLMSKSSLIIYFLPYCLSPGCSTCVQMTLLNKPLTNDRHLAIQAAEVNVSIFSVRFSYHFESLFSLARPCSTFIQTFRVANSIYLSAAATNRVYSFPFFLSFFLSTFTKKCLSRYECTACFYVRTYVAAIVCVHGL